MNNPILKSSKTLFLYLGIWLFMATAAYLIMSNIIDVNKVQLAADIYIQNILFAGILIGMWYPISFMSIENQKVFSLVLNYVLTYIVFVLVWVGLNNLILRLIFTGIAETDYFKAALPFKLIFSFFGFFIFVISVNFIKYYNSYIDKKDIENKLYSSLKEAELSQLRNQLNPHFIFNSLNSISSLTILDPAKAQEMVIKLSDFLRYTVSNAQQAENTLGRELEMCEAYLDIEKVRFGDKILFNIKVDPAALEIKLPSLLLQPLFENAIKHGIHGSLNAEMIDFNAFLSENRLLIKLENSFDASQVPRIGTQSGLKNIKSRLALNYNNEAFMNTDIIENKYIVTINLPIKK